MTSTAATEAMDAIDRQLDALEAALKDSPADETELVWIESHRDGVSSGRSRRNRHDESSILMVRVIERGRLGAFRTGASARSDLGQAIRQAIAHSRTRDPMTGLPHLPADTTPLPENLALHDPEIAKLSTDAARELLRKQMNSKTHAQLEWVEAHVAVANSRGVRRFASVTSVQATARIGGGPGGAAATAAARRLDGLDLQALEASALERSTSAPVEEWKPAELPVVFSPSATRQLIDVLNRYAFSAASYADGISFLREHLGIQVFDRTFNLYDDGTAAIGLPFPFDLEGTAKQKIDLVSEGTPRTPALDQRQAALLGLPPTGHAIGGNDALAQNLFLKPNPEFTDERLLEVSDGGLWVEALHPIECFEPDRIRIRAGLRGVRRIRDGKRDAPVPDLLVQGSLLRGVSNLLGIGDQPEVGWLADRGVFGGCSTPAIALAAVSSLEPLP